MGNSTAERVAQLLLAFDPDGTGQVGDRSVSELARKLGRERSQVSRMLAALREAKVVDQDPETRRYRLSWRVRVMAAGAGDDRLIRVTKPVLQALVARTGEVALLSVQEGNRSLTVLREEGPSELKAGGWVGRKSPMHCTASGRALLFDASDELVEDLTVDDLTTLKPARSQAPGSVDDLLTRLRQERRQGYALASDEVESGLTSIAAPVRDAQHLIAAVINISGPTSRVLPAVGSNARLVVTAAAAASTQLTHRLER